MLKSPQIYILLSQDGHVEDINVLSADHQDRIYGFEIIKALQAEIEAFESKVVDTLERLRRAH